ncbi:MAG TPA: NAD(P)H-dependent oxidoreductase [Bacteroidia bacterium]|nr:NAD(P)H-dependent oxidoreductase [Bacteroidia bacterium]
MTETKPHIVIISASVREGRKSHRIALFFKKFIEEQGQGTVEIADLNEYQFPIFTERSWLQKNPTEKVLEFAGKIKNADGVIIVTPEYNGGYPASLKNVVDLLYDEWHHKPIAISTVSNGVFGGSQVITSLQFSLWKIRAIVVPATFPCPSIEKNFTEDGSPVNKEFENKRATGFINELFWFIEAARKMKP